MSTAEELLVDVSHVTKTFSSRTGLRSYHQTIAVDDVTFTLSAGEILGIVGESGSGKTTVARLIAGFDAPSKGSITVAGRPLEVRSDPRPAWLPKKVQYVFQDPFGSLDPRMTVGEIIAEPLRIQGASRSDSHQSARVLIPKVGLRPEDMSRMPHEFSGGQRQRIAIARALTQDPEIMVLDEPVSALDVSIQAQIINLLLSLQSGTMRSYILISHDLGVVRRIASRVLVMHNGSIVESGATEEIFRSPEHPYTQSLISSIPVPHPRLRRRTSDALCEAMSFSKANRETKVQWLR